MPRREIGDFDGGGDDDDCRIVDAAFARVSRYQCGQILALILAFIFSTGSCLALSYVNIVLTPECVLFSKWVLSEKRPFAGARSFFNESNTSSAAAENGDVSWSSDRKPPQALLYFLPALSVWGKKRHCYLTQFGFAAAAAGSFILCWFFVFVRPSKEAFVLKKKTTASKLVVPGIVSCSAFTICTLVAAVTVQSGFVAWCQSLEVTTSTENSNNVSCSSATKYGISWPDKTTSIDFFSVLLTSQVLSWIAAVIWICNAILLVKRLYHHVDFPGYFFHSLIPSHNRTLQSETESN